MHCSSWSSLDNSAPNELSCECEVTVSHSTGCIAGDIGLKNCPHFSKKYTTHGVTHSFPICRKSVCGITLVILAKWVEV